MKKSTKLLSVLLAIVMIFSSMSVMASAAKTEYKTVDALGENGLNAYSPYGAVTRLTTEERLSILFDYLDVVLADLNIKTTFDLSVLGSLNIDLTSLDGALNLIDQVKDLLDNNSFILGLITKDTSILRQLNFSGWTKGMTRETTSQYGIVEALLNLLKANTAAVDFALTKGLLFGKAIGFIDLDSLLSGTLDLSGINAYLLDLPGTIKSLIYPMLERSDDNMEQINFLVTNASGNGGVITVLNTYIQGLFTRNMSKTTYKEDATGCISDHTLPGEGALYRVRYIKGSDAKGDYIETFRYDTEKADWFTENQRYYKTEELNADGTGTGVYVYTKTNADGSTENIKYYKNNSTWLPSYTAAGESFDLTTDSAATLLYKFIPYVFADMAPVVLNGSVKKLFAQALGAKFTYVGEKGSAEVVDTIPAADYAASDFFTKEQGSYLWEWSDYAVINGNHYYRYEDQIFISDLSAVTDFFDLINWNWQVTADFLNEFIPGNTAHNGNYTTVLGGLNDFCYKVLSLIANPSNTTAASIVSNWATGDNSNLLSNLKTAAQTIVQVQPEAIFGSNYADADCYYNLIMSTNAQEVLTGIACTVIDLVMPQMILPSATQLAGRSDGLAAVLTAVVRELATQLVPNINYDELIYENYNNKTLKTHTVGEWLDIMLTIGTDIGIHYLKNLADMGEDQSAWSGAWYEDSYTYTVAIDWDDMVTTTGVKTWEARVDYIIDWALTSTEEYGWHFDKLLNIGTTASLGTAQDPWAKLETVLSSILPITDVFRIDTSTSGWLEKLLRTDIVEAVLGLSDTTITTVVPTLLNYINIPDNSVLRTTNTLQALTDVVRDLLNDILLKVTGNVELISSTTFTNLDTLANQSNLNALIDNLLVLLPTALANGLLDPIMPLLGFWVGWTTNAQKMQDPNVQFVNRATGYDADGNAYTYETGFDYIYAQASEGNTIQESIVVTNASAGMLLTHPRKTGSDPDTANTIYITNITSDDSTFSWDGTTVAIAPYASKEIPISLTYSGDKTLSFTITYYYMGKDGTPVGGEQQMNAYFYMTNVDANEYTQVAANEKYVEVKNTAVSKVDAIKVKREAFNREIYATSLEDAINSFYLTYTDTNDQTYATWVYSATGSNLPAFVTANQAYVHGDDENLTLKAEGLGWLSTSSDNEVKTNSLAPLTYVTGFDDSAYVSGTTVALGSIDVVWHNHKKDGNWGVGDGGDQKITLTTDLGEIYIVDTSSVEDAFNKYDAMNLSRAMFTADADAEWTAFQDAMKAAKRTCTLRYMLDKTTFANEFGVATLEQRVADLDNAYNALIAKSQGSSVDVLVTAEANHANDVNGVEINYQDYELYEYFEYQDERTETRNRIKAYQQPTAPEKYIKDSSLSYAEIQSIISGAGSKAAAIGYTVLDPDQAAIDAYNEAIANWTAPGYTALDNANQAMMYGYYKGFLIPNTTTKQFIEKEITYADTNYPAYNADGSAVVNTTYSDDSWAAYVAAYDNAVAVNENTAALQSQVFDAKYALMKAENELLLKTKSAKETGALNALTELAAEAEAIFANPTNYTLKAGVTEADAYAALITALGYTYTDADGKAQILYEDSAAEYLKYDRETTESNLARIATCEANLAAAIANFEAVVTDPILTSFAGSTGVVDTVNKYVYGIAVGTEATYAAFSAYFTVENGTFEISGNGTGATLSVKNNSGDVVDTYTLVVFGDVNGDGEVNGVDATKLAQYSSGATSVLSGFYLVAGDLNADGSANGVDATKSAQYAGGATSVISQTVGVYAG